MSAVNEQHKDRLFKFIFGNPEKREWTLSLYNALNGSSYTNPDEIEINTIEDAVYMGMKNDVSFIIVNSLNIWEHQSSFNPNIPLRIFMYLAHVLEKYLADNDIYRYGGTLVNLPTPKCLCFYNGTDEQPDEKILKLSDAFVNNGLESDVELRVRMLNINYGRNEELMKQCKAMNEYSWFVDAIRRHKKVLKGLEAAVDAAINEMPNKFALKRFLVGHRAEVKGMYLTEWDEEKARAVWRAEGLEKGRAEGRAEGITEDRARVASDMLKKNLPLSLIKDISLLSEEVILKLAENLGISVV